MYESHWDKDKKQPRSKSVMAFGYVQDLISGGIPDPIAYYSDFVAKKNMERAASLAEETRPRAFASPVELSLGHFLLHTLLEELNVREVIDILSAQMRFRFSVYHMMAQLIFSRVISPCSKAKTVSAVFPHLYNSFPISEDFTTAWLLLANPTKNISSSLTIAMSSITREISAMYFLIVRIIISRSICPVEISRKALPKRNGMTPSSGRHFSLTRIWFRWPCRCFPETNRKNLISGRSLRK